MNFWTRSRRMPESNLEWIVPIGAVIVVAVALCATALWQAKEPFELEENAAHGIFYRENPCGRFRECGACAAAAGCGWCADAERCAPMAQDGFPIRYRADTGAMLPVCAPYGFITEARKCFA